jgi:hypothetical protein
MLCKVLIAYSSDMPNGDLNFEQESLKSFQSGIILLLCIDKHALIGDGRLSLNSRKFPFHYANYRYDS